MWSLPVLFPFFILFCYATNTSTAAISIAASSAASIAAATTAIMALSTTSTTSTASSSLSLVYVSGASLGAVAVVSTRSGGCGELHRRAAKLQTNEK